MATKQKKASRFLSRFYKPAEKAETTNTNVSGFVERVSPAAISGWALQKSGGSPVLELYFKEKKYDVVIEWSERADVAGNLGLENIKPGFQINVPDELAELLGQSEALTQLVVLADGSALSFSARLKEIESMEQTKAKVKHSGVASSSKIKGNIDDFDAFFIRGWGVDTSLTGSKPAISVRCNGHLVECPVIPVERKDAAEALALVDTEVGFDIELSGYIWEYANGRGECHIEVVLGDKLLTAKPLIIKRNVAIARIEAVRAVADEAQRQYQSLLAIEHVRHLHCMEMLDKETSQFLVDTAQKYGLEEFLLEQKEGVEAQKESEQEAADEEREVPLIQVDTLLLWKALRRLNERLSKSNGSVFAHVKNVMDELGLRAEPRYRYILSVIPLLCRNGEFINLRSVVEFNTLYRLDHSDNTWEMSLAIAPLVADNNIGRATDLMWRLTKQLNAGWLNTECIRFAIETNQNLESSGEIDLTTAERFRYAVLGVLDSFMGEWFSRLHDQELVDSVILLLKDAGRYTDYHKNDICLAAIKHYGLSPSFWKRLPSDVLDSLPEIKREYEAWQAIHSIINDASRPLNDRLDELREPLMVFRRAGNSDAVIFGRELVANTLPELNVNLSQAGKLLLADCLSVGNSEALRVAGFPLPTKNELQAVFPETSQRLRNTLRQLTEREKSVVFDLQCNASAALIDVQSCFDTGDKAKLQTALERLMRAAMALNNWQGNFLSVDLLAGAYCYAMSAGLDGDIYLIRFADAARKSVSETNVSWFLPAPVCAGISRLVSLGGDSVLRGVLQELKQVISERFGDRHNSVFKRDKKIQISVDSNGWPKDTLVVIYSCRKYLGTRVKAIRETWVDDLKARGIPYLILVGDGDDSVHGDVLELAVSDKYEDLPKKTLKMIDWVYKNTNAQYVMKIDDDCFLNVSQHFGALSYRKHMYYGRTIKRGIGSMDRAWHHSKSHSEYSKNAIDKSPEPSVYADGGGAYTLSRLAMEMLLDAEKTIQGRRLMACSFMEDKLVGDLLSLKHIAPSNEDYESYQRRRTFGDAMPVAMWENTFFPSVNTVTNVVHLDTDKDMVSTRARMAGDELWPKKIWPTCWSPSIKLNSNQLELLTDVEKASSLLRENIVVVAVVRNEMVLLPHFLDHYRKLGINSFIIADNCSDDGTREYLYEQPDVVLYSADTEYKHSHFGVAWQQAILGNHCIGKWVLIADADELLVYENCEHWSLKAFIAEIETEGRDAVCIEMIDMYPSGKLSDADFEKDEPFKVAPWFDSPALTPWRLGTGWFSNMSGYVSHLRHRKVPDAVPHDFVAQKFALFRYQPWVRLSQGVHYQANLDVSEKKAWFAHFKYHAGFAEKVEAEIRRKQHYNNAFEYQRYAAMLAESGGAFGEEGISQRYEDSSSFRLTLPE